MDHNQSPVLEAMAEYHQRGYANFCPPGHKQGRGADERVIRTLGADVFRSDLLATGGLDDRMSRGKVLERAQELMADAVGAEHAFFSTCGSSLSVKSAMMAVAAPGESMLIGRDAHKSMIAGLTLTGIHPIWVRPRWDPELHLAHPPSPEQVEKAFEEHPEAVGALVTSPSPSGTCSDLEGIREVCHKRGKPLIVDEAWGAHLPFHDDLPTWAMDAGADVCVVSVHKMGMGFEQGSVFHLQGDLVDPSLLSACADLLMTTSPNVLLYSAIDGWRRQMVRDGKRLLGDALDLARFVRTEIEQRDGLHVLHEELLHEQASHDLDLLHVLIDLDELGITGYQASDWLRENCHVDLGLSDHRRVEATLSMADDRETAGRLLGALDALLEAAPGFDRPPKIDFPSYQELEIEPVLLPRDAFFGPTEMVPVRESVGRVCAEQVTPYPPGIPVLIPGERINQGIVDYLRSGLAAGMSLPDPADQSLEEIKVVALP